MWSFWDFDRYTWFIVIYIYTLAYFLETSLYRTLIRDITHIRHPSLLFVIFCDQSNYPPFINFLHVFQDFRLKCQFLISSVRAVCSAHLSRAYKL
jgi:hypothetical protein